MKKNISINIGGIIFHIEEDGFEELKSYLDAINRYFSDFTDSQEIISDIENRIAEIFLGKLKEDKQIIDKDDVQALMATLGSIEDFRKAEEGEEVFEEEATTAHEKAEYAGGTKKLFRDTNRKIFGGVAAGIAHYFAVDVLWIRLLLIVAFLGLFPFEPISLFIFLGYILCWIFLPANPELKEDEKIKKLYRSEENKVIGGVAKGLAAYFGTDVAVIRILFVLLLIPGGAGFFIYIVLWIITPTAKTVTQKMQMEGTPITLSNIEKNIKSSLKVEQGEESVLVKILLFPFRLIAIILNGLAKALGPILNFVVDAIRVILGIVMVCVGLALSVGIIVMLFVSQGVVFNPEYVHFFNIPHQVIADTISPELLIISFITLIIPAIIIMVAGISVMARKWLLNKTVGLALFAVWFISIIGAAVLVPATVMKFKSDGTITQQYEYLIKDKTAVLKLNEVGYEDYDVSTLTLRGYEGEAFKLEKRFRSQGSSRLDAEQNAGMVTHEVNLKNDSILWIDSNIQFAEDAKFRGQTLRMTLYVPYGATFEFDRKMEYILRNTININGYNNSQITGNTWMFDESGLQCLTCEEVKTSKYYSNEDKFFRAPFRLATDMPLKNIEVDDFDRISGATGLFLEIRQGDGYDLQVYAEDESDLENFKYELRNGRLKLYFEQTRWGWRNRVPDVKCVITLPAFKSLELSSAAVAHLINVKGEKLNVDLSSASKLYADLAYEDAYFEISSAATAILKGYANHVDVDISSAAKMEGYELRTNTADVDASSASKVEILVSEKLDASASSAAKISYKGSPSIKSNSSSGGKVSAD